MPSETTSPVRFPLATILACLAVILSFIVLGGLNAWKIYTDTVKTWEESTRIQQLSRDIVHLDEVMTTSVRLGVTTGDVSWEKRYRRNEPRLRVAIDSLKKMSPAFAVEQFVEQTENANNELVAMETRAFSMIREGRVKDAKVILLGEEYQTQKKIYSRGIKDLIHEMELKNERQIGENTQRFILFSLFCGVFIFLSGYAALVLLNNHLVRRRNAEKALAKSEEQLKYALDVSSDGIWDWDVRTGRVDFSDNWVDSLGYPSIPFPNNIDIWEQIIHPDDYQKTMDALNDHCNGRTPLCEVVNRLKKSDGTYRWNLNVGKVVEADDDGNPVRIVGIDKDITREREAEILSTRFGRVVDNSFNEIYLFDAETLKFIQVSVGACKNLQYSLEELTRLTPLDIKPEFTREAFEELIEPLRFKRQLMVIFETVHKRKDGTLYPVSIRMQLMHEETPPVFLAIVEDITVRKKQEEQLRIAGAELERSNRELTEFAAIVSHDLQEPLRKVVIFGDQLMKKVSGTDEQSADLIDRMQKATLRMKLFIEDLLIYSKVISQPVPLKVVDLKHVVKEVIDILEVQLYETRGSVNFWNLPSIEGDHFQMCQVFQNLISNSLKYHVEGIPPVINISGQPLENGQYEIVLEDNGIGFDEKYVDKIFQPFQRLHTRDAYSGTGMGLTICRKIIERHNGTLTVNSQPNEGSVFRIILSEKQPQGEPSTPETLEETTGACPEPGRRVTNFNK